jgi:RED-like protein N-terminal region
MADMYSNPLPPLSMRPPASEPPQTPKSNADFRALLATPRAERGSYHSILAGDASGERKEPRKEKAKKPQKPKPAGEEEKKDDDGAGYRCVTWEAMAHGSRGVTSSCQTQRAGITPALVKTPYAYFRRDRADERRKGVNPDYDGGLSDLSAHPGSMQVRQPAGDTIVMRTPTHSCIWRYFQGLIAHHRRWRAPLQGANLTIDETKFLGGDVEHTHLVKGLDYALLQKASWWFRSFRHRAHAQAFGMCSGSHAGVLQYCCTRRMRSCTKHGSAEINHIGAGADRGEQQGGAGG